MIRPPSCVKYLQVLKYYFRKTMDRLLCLIMLACAHERRKGHKSLFRFLIKLTGSVITRKYNKNKEKMRKPIKHNNSCLKTTLLTQDQTMQPKTLPQRRK
mmetsp:Transcript_6075/g.7455  ORF Transcript_6075/g.7455 Transcript_6075/m.7455 type:complete len:100 (-) Transcript_6075:65-364(-)